MTAYERAEVCRVLRLVAEEYYDGKKYSAPHRNGICYAAKYAGGGDHPSVYPLLADAFELLGMNRKDPFTDEEHGETGDWTVRPMFCLLMADALEQME